MLSGLFHYYFSFLGTFSFPNLGIQHVTRKSVTKVLMDRYLKMQTLHTATLNALTTDAAIAEQALAGVDSAAFNKHMAEAVAGKMHCFLQIV